MDVIPLAQANLVDNARLYATRHDLVRHLGRRATGGVICEIGVEFGNFSEYLIDTLKPTQFWAFDLFDLHTYQVEKFAKTFGQHTHEQFYRARLHKKPNTEVRVLIGDSGATLREVPDATFDLVYVDGDHRLEGATKDAIQSARVLKADGVLIFNDYILYDHYARMDYGVVPVVNDLCVNQGWRVAGFALQQAMFCDIALVRS